MSSGLRGQTAPAPQLYISLLEGDGGTHIAGSTSYNGFTVLVHDAKGQPVPKAQVTFRLPGTGPTGVFPGGGLSETAFTTENGKASVWGIQWKKETGRCQVSITARLGTGSAGTIAHVRLVGAEGGKKEPAVVAAPVPAPITAAPALAPTAPVASFEVAIGRNRLLPASSGAMPTVARPSETPVASEALESAKRPGVVFSRTSGPVETISAPRSKWIVIGLGIAGIAGGGLAYRLTRGSSPTSPTIAPPDPVRNLSLGPPAITIGKP